VMILLIIALTFVLVAVIKTSKVRKLDAPPTSVGNGSLSYR
jgi:hypothetical protein